MHIVRIYHSPEEAYAALSMLQAYGTDAKILDSETLSILPLDSVALGGYRLAVPEHQVKDALDLLTDRAQTQQSVPNPQYFGDEYDVEAQAGEGMERLAGGNPNILQLYKKPIIIGMVLIFIGIMASGVFINDLDWIF